MVVLGLVRVQQVRQDLAVSRTGRVLVANPFLLVDDARVSMHASSMLRGRLGPLTWQMVVMYMAQTMSGTETFIWSSREFRRTASACTWRLRASVLPLRLLCSVWKDVHRAASEASKMGLLPSRRGRSSNIMPYVKSPYLMSSDFMMWTSSFASFDMSLLGTRRGAGESARCCLLAACSFSDLKRNLLAPLPTQFSFRRLHLPQAGCFSSH